MQAGAVFPFDDCTLFTDGLDGIEQTNPYAGTYNCKSAFSGCCEIYKHIFACHKRNQQHDQKGGKKIFPLLFIYKQTKTFSDINLCLSDPVCTTIFHLCPLVSLYFWIKYSARPSPPSSERLIFLTIPSKFCTPKKRQALFGSPS